MQKRKAARGRGRPASKRRSARTRDVTSRPSSGMSSRAEGSGLRVALAGALFGLALLAFWPSVHNGFIEDWDDASYVVDNPDVAGGLSFGSVAWALTARHSANWHPLTWLSHMTDVELYGLEPAGHHRTSVLLHAVNTVLLFLALISLLEAARGTEDRLGGGALCKAALVAALFALHPLRVESVAWVSERKDLLSGFFFFLMLIGYGRYVQRPGAARLLGGVVLPLGLGLMSKPMLVTAPAILLLLDAWPLGRLAAGGASVFQRIRPLVVEKWPLFALVLASTVVTFVAQGEAGAISELGHVEIGPRIANALAAFGFYLEKTLVPVGLAAFYPQLGEVYSAAETWRFAWPGAALLLGLAALAVGLRARAPYVTLGFAWFVVMLLPVIGLVQVGAQGWADRYTYLPLIGPAIGLVWGVGALVQGGGRASRWVAGVIALGALVGCMVLTRLQIETWHDRETLWLHALEVVPRNYKAAQRLGVLRFEEGRVRDALKYAELADEIVPNWSKNQAMMGLVLTSLGEHRRARAPLEAALVELPDEVQLYIALATGAMASKEWGRAIPLLESALERSDDDYVVHFKLGKALAASGRLDEALVHLERASRLRSDDLGLRLAYAQILEVAGRIDEAVAVHRSVLALSPGNPQASAALQRLEAAN